MSCQNLRVYHRPIRVLPPMQGVRAGMWHTGGMMSTAVSDAERRQRRLEKYHARHRANVHRHELHVKAVASTQHQQTALLLQRWLDSHCKRTPVSKTKIIKSEAVTAEPNAKSVIPVSSLY